MYTQKQFDRLPIWAQQEIIRLKGSVEYQQKHLDAVLSGTSGITVYNNAGSIKPSGYLPKFAYIHIGDVRIKYVEKSLSRFENYIDVSGNGQLIVRPRASNQVYISTEPF